ELGMGGGRNFAIVGYLANVPQSLDRRARLRERADVVVARRVCEHQDVLGDGRAGEAIGFRRGCEGSLQRSDRREVLRRGAPLQELDRVERMAFERLRKLRFERRASSGGAKGAVAGGAARAAGDLRELGRVELSKLVAVEFAVGGKGDVIDVEVEPHANGI